LECARPGWQPRNWGPPRAYTVKKPSGYKKGGVSYPAVPCSVEDQALALIEAVKAGCVALHVHPRDPEDCMSSDAPELLAAVYDEVFQEVDAVTLQHTWYPHKDEVIQKNVDCVNKIVDFCKLTGREIADVKTARKILGITRTS